MLWLSFFSSSFSFFWNLSCDYGFVFLSFGRTSLDYDFMNLNTKHHINWPANACYHDQKQILIPFQDSHTHTLDDSTVKAYLCVCVSHGIRKGNNWRRVNLEFFGYNFYGLASSTSLPKFVENKGKWWLVEHGGGHYSQTNKHGFFWRRLW